MNVKVEKDKLVIELTLEEPWKSSTGKTLLVASTHGVQRTTARFEGKPISIVVNAFVNPGTPKKSGGAVQAKSKKYQSEEEDRDYEDEGDE